MQTSKYQVFVKVVECRSLTKAAEELHYTQSGISHIIKNLEKDLGFPLLIRSNTDFRLTSEGEALLPVFREIALGEEKLRQTASAILGVQEGKIRIGSMCSVSSLWMPYILKEFMEQHPKVEVELVDTDYEEAEKLLESDRIDCAFLPKPISPNLTHELLYMDPFFVVMPKGHPWCSRETIPMELFEGEDFIVPTEGMKYRMGDLFRKHDVHPNLRLRTRDDYGTLSLVFAGLGVTILSEMLLKCYSMDVEVRPLEGEAYRDLGFCLRKDRKVNPVTELFHQYVLKWAKGNLTAHDDV